MSLNLIKLITVSTVCVAAVSDEGQQPRPDTLPVQFVVMTPATAAQEVDVIYCSMSLDSWPAGGRRLARVGPNLYTSVFELPGNAAIEYKFLRSAKWTTVEKGPGGQEVPNRILRTSADSDRMVVLCDVAQWADEKPRNTKTVIPPNIRQAATSTLSGDIRVHEEFQSPELANRRDVLVYLPPGYEDAADRYPTLYIHDGQNVFDQATSFKGAEWGMDESAEALIRAGRIAKCIIVAVAHSPAREREYIPCADASAGVTEPQGDAYLQFLTGTLKPFIDRTYRTKPEREQTVLAGASFGGLITAYATCHRADTFGGFAIIAPSLWWADAHVLALLPKCRIPAETKFWIEVGRGAGWQAVVANVAGLSPELRQSREMVRILEEKGWQRDRLLHYAELPGVFHDEPAWQMRNEAMLRFFFPPASAETQ